MMNGILTDAESGDLLVIGGALAIGDSTEQVAECVINAARGEFKEYPLIGAEVRRLLGGNSDPMWCADTKRMLESCGVGVSRVALEDNQIVIE